MFLKMKASGASSMNKLEQAYREMRELLDKWNKQGIDFTINIHSLYECDYYTAVLKIEEIPQASVDEYENEVHLYYE